MNFHLQTKCDCHSISMMIISVDKFSVTRFCFFETATWCSPFTHSPLMIISKNKLSSRQHLEFYLLIFPFVLWYVVFDLKSRINFTIEMIQNMKLNKEKLSYRDSTHRCNLLVFDEHRDDRHRGILMHIANVSTNNQHNSQNNVNQYSAMSVVALRWATSRTIMFKDNYVAIRSHQGWIGCIKDPYDTSLCGISKCCSFKSNILTQISISWSFKPLSVETSPWSNSLSWYFSRLGKLYLL